MKICQLVSSKSGRPGSGEMETWAMGSSESVSIQVSLWGTSPLSPHGGMQNASLSRLTSPPCSNPWAFPERGSFWSPGLRLRVECSCIHAGASLRHRTLLLQGSYCWMLINDAIPDVKIIMTDSCVVCTCNPGTRDVDAGGLWIWQFLLGETLSHNNHHYIRNPNTGLTKQAFSSYPVNTYWASTKYERCVHRHS